MSHFKNNWALSVATFLLVLVAGSLWLTLAKRTEKTSWQRPESLGATEQQRWHKVVSDVTSAAVGGVGLGPDVNDVLNTTKFQTIDRKILNFANGKYAVMSGYVGCGVCSRMLSRMPRWEKKYGFEAIFFTRIEDLDSGKENLLNDSIDTVTYSVSEDSYPHDPFDFSSPAFFIISDGVVKFKFVGASDGRFDFTKIFSALDSANNSFRFASYLTQGEQPANNIELQLLDAELIKLPEKFQGGINVVYVHDFECPNCQVLSEPYLGYLNDLAHREDGSVTTWVITYDSPSVVDDLQEYIKPFPNIKFGYTPGIESSDELSSHPLQAWGRMLRPETLVFVDNKLFAYVPTEFVDWGDGPEPSAYIASVEGVVRTAVEDFQLADSSGDGLDEVTACRVSKEVRKAQLSYDSQTTCGGS